MRGGRQSGPPAMHTDAMAGKNCGRARAWTERALLREKGNRALEDALDLGIWGEGTQLMDGDNTWDN